MIATSRRSTRYGVPRTTGRSPIRTAALTAGVIFLLVGVLGFVPGVTHHVDTITFAGHDSGATLLGLFQVSILHNVVHLLFGLVGILAARTAAGARSYLIVGGVIYLVLWIYGLVISDTSGANFVPSNTADDWLHLFLGVGMIGPGVAFARRTRATSVDAKRMSSPRR